MLHVIEVLFYETESSLQTFMCMLNHFNLFLEGSEYCNFYYYSLVLFVLYHSYFHPLVAYLEQSLLLFSLCICLKLILNSADSAYLL